MEYNLGFALTLVYIVVTLISPEQFGQEVASYHPMVYLAGITAVASFPDILTRKTYWQSSIQAKLVLGLIGAVVFSQLAHGLVGGSLTSLREMLPVAAVFFFVCANATTDRRLKIIIAVIIVACLGISGEALLGYYTGFRGDSFVLLEFGKISRLRAAGFLNDPNDFGQFLLITLSLLLVNWNRRRNILNSFFVLVTAAVLLWAVYLTHSRGALVTLGVLVLLALHRKIGKIPSIALACTFIFAMMAANFTGGRGISAADGTDRLELWSEGLQLFKSAPVFGIGFGRFTDFSDLTAHNSFVLCLAELGLVGSTIVVALFVTTLMKLNSIINSEEQSMWSADSHAASESGEGHSHEYMESSCEPQTSNVETDEREVNARGEVDRQGADLNPFATPMRLAIISFITTSVFLSRTYTTTMYLLLGVATAAIGLEGNSTEVTGNNRWIVTTLVTEVAAVTLIYCAVRLRS